MMTEEKNNPIDILNSIRPEINEARDLVTFEGKVYDLKDGEDKKGCLFITFNLNYHEDFTIRVYVDPYTLQKISKAGGEIKLYDYVEVTGWLGMWKPTNNNKNQSFMVQLKAKTIYHKDIAPFYCVPKVNPKPLPENPHIALISNKNGAGKEDFRRKISRNYNISNEEYDTKMEGSDALNDIASSIEKANSDDDINLICIVRGGGDEVRIRYVFDNPIVCNAIMNSKKPVLVGVGHTKDFTNADRASDAPLGKNGFHRYFITPTELGSYLNSHYYKADKALEAAKVAAKEETKVEVLADEKATAVSYNKYLVVIIVMLLLYIVFVK